MTFTDAVKIAIEEYFKINLKSEQKRGRANQVDFMGFSPLIGEIRIELERRREDPLNNVVKAWRQAVESLEEKPFTLIHIFSGFYISKKAKFENANFVGDRMSDWAGMSNRPIKYVSILLDFTPLQNDSDPDIDEKAIHTIHDQISTQLRSKLEL